MPFPFRVRRNLFEPCQIRRASCRSKRTSRIALRQRCHRRRELHCLQCLVRSTCRLPPRSAPVLRIPRDTWHLHISPRIPKNTRRTSSDSTTSTRFTDRFASRPTFCGLVCQRPSVAARSLNPRTVQKHEVTNRLPGRRCRHRHATSALAVFTTRFPRTFRDDLMDPPSALSVGHHRHPAGFPRPNVSDSAKTNR